MDKNKVILVKHRHDVKDGEPSCEDCYMYEACSQTEFMPSPFGECESGEYWTRSTE